jgi:hypothetical protein
MGYDTDVCRLSRGQNFCRVEEESAGGSIRASWELETRLGC